MEGEKRKTCEYLVDNRLCQHGSRKIRQESCKNETKDFCCYLCGSRTSCGIRCMYLSVGALRPEDMTRLDQKIEKHDVWDEKEVRVVTTPNLPGYEIIEVMGVVHGLTVRTRGIGGKFVAGIQGMLGGEITMFSSECEKAREESLRRLIDNAKKVGANAIVAVDFETSDILQGTATLFSAFGTAVVVKPIGK